MKLLKETPTKYTSERLAYLDNLRDSFKSFVTGGLYNISTQEETKFSKVKTRI